MNKLIIMILLLTFATISNTQCHPTPDTPPKHEQTSTYHAPIQESNASYRIGCHLPPGDSPKNKLTSSTSSTVAHGDSCSLCTHKPSTNSAVSFLASILAIFYAPTYSDNHDYKKNKKYLIRS